MVVQLQKDAGDSALLQGLSRDSMYGPDPNLEREH